MILMATSTCPTTSFTELMKAGLKNFQELPFPDYVKQTGPYGLIGEEGMKVYTILEIEKGKEDEFLELFNKRVFKYTLVKGYTLKVEILMTVQEILSFIDLEAS